MIDREQAEAAVSEAHASAFPPGSFMIGEVREDDRYFALTFGAREWMIDGDDAHMIIGSWPVFLNKATGAEELPPGVESVTDALDRLDAMDLVADHTRPKP